MPMIIPAGAPSAETGFILSSPLPLVPRVAVAEISKKMPDLNAASLEAAMSMIAGTARSMGITVEE